MTVYLDYWKAELIDLRKHYETYDNPRSQYRLLQGAPLLVNVEGHYVRANDLPDLVVSRNKFFVNQWLIELRNPPNNGGIVLNFKWRR